MCTAGVVVSTENGHTPLPNDATSILERLGVCVCCECFHKASILEAITQRIQQPLISFYLAGCMCVHMSVCESEGS